MGEGWQPDPALYWPQLVDSDTRQAVEHSLAAYTDELMRIMNQYGIRSEVEAWTGIILKFTSTLKRNKASAVVSDRDLLIRIRGEAASLTETSMPDDPLREARLGEAARRLAFAWYTVAYGRLVESARAPPEAAFEWRRRGERARPPRVILSFPWAVHEVVCMARAGESAAVLGRFCADFARKQLQAAAARS
eukprot:tig00020904_g15150.t1